MSVRMRHTSSHTKNRRSHHALKAANLVKDEESGTLRLPHRVNEATGLYRGKQVIAPAILERRKERAEAAAKRQASPMEGISEPVHVQSEENIPAAKVKEGVLGRFTKGKAKARSGFGGTA